MEEEAVIPSPALVVLIGASGSGKSTWAEANFKPGQVLSTDDFRAFYGSGPDDQTAGTEAFALLDQLLDARLAKKLTTVVDTLGLDEAKRAAYRAAARSAGVACIAVCFATEPALCRERNRERARPITKTVLDRQLRSYRKVAASVVDEGFDAVIVNPGTTRLISPDMLTRSGAGSPSAGTVSATAGFEPEADAASGPGRSAAMQFDLVVSSFVFDGEIEPTLVGIATAAEAAGFRALWVMDHFRQVPQVGRAWDPMLESYTTLAYLAAKTERLRLGTLVTGIEHRNIGLLAKIIATLDVLSHGRAECGLGAGWFDAEQRAYGYPVNSDRERLDTLEDALQALPLLWGPGAKSFDGSALQVPEAMGYPRPVQDPVPILVGGGGEKRTLRLAARYADAANVIGDVETVAHKIEVLRRHCEDVDRDPEEVAMTTLNPLIHATSGPALADLVERLRPANRSSESFLAVNNAGTTEEHIDRFARMAEIGVARACVALTANDGPDRVEAFGEVIAAAR